MSHKQNQKCSIVIRCYKGEQHNGRLLRGIMQQTVRDVETIVADSGSTDRTLSIASQYPVRIVAIEPDEFSFGRSLNRGCQAANSDFVVITNAHVYPSYNDWLEKILTPFGNPRVALVYGKQRGDEATKYSEHQNFFKLFPEKSNYERKDLFCNNANVAIWKSLWKEVPYDESLMGLEDLGWAKRIMQMGYKIAHASDDEVVHVHNEPALCIYNRYRREALALTRITPQERFSRWDFVRLFTANVVSNCYHTFREKVLGHNLASIFFFRLMQFWGTYRGFAQRGPITS